MSPPVERIIPSSEMPEHTDVVIIGGGIVGVCTALFLSQKGVKVVLCEKGEIGAEQSSRNWGWCRTLSRDERELPLAIESLRLWRSMDQMVGGETGFRQCGIMSLCDTDEELRQAQEWREHAMRYQLEVRILSREELKAEMPEVVGNYKGAIFAPTDGRAEPMSAAPAIARGVQALGGTVLTNCAVRGVKVDNGRVSGVYTERGVINAPKVVLAGGVWSSLMCRQLGIRLPQLKVLGNVMRTAPLDGAPDISVKGTGFGMRKRLDGGYNVAFGQSNEAQIVPDSFRFLFDFLPRFWLERKSIRLRLGRRFWQELSWAMPWKMNEVSPFEKNRILDPKPLNYDLSHARRNIQKAIPAFKESTVVEAWAGLIDATPDAVPVISNVDALPGLILSTGYSGHGFGLGPGAGRLTAEIVMGTPTCVDPAPYAFSRFKR